MRLKQSILWLASIWIVVAAAQAQSVIEKLVSPGPLAAAHAKLEARCSACHAQFDKGAQAKLCVSCHKTVGADVATGKGYHGRYKPASGECRTCHSDHRGRGAALIKFNTKAFDHNLTDYPLKGKHTGLECAQCHKSEKKYRQAPVACAACHAGKDVHKGRLGTNCTSCHNESDWKKATFDHSTTRFPLLGAHTRAACTACHADKQFADTPMECISCHRKDDAHHGALGEKCASCHGVSAWKPAKFDHNTTGFPLLGRHDTITCKACHTSPGGAVKLPTACVSCHRKDDAHKGRLGPNCGDCHSATNWKQEKFDHSRTSFPLHGRHATIDCAQCHTQPPAQKKLAMTCDSCHAKDDKHEGQLGRDCARCHGEAAWKTDVRFDHGLVSFPLLGKHSEVACKQCHASPRFKDAQMACISCHKKDDRHKGTLGAQCADCHNAVNWQNASFNHDTQTSFPLTGAHAKVECARCHQGTLKVSTFCVDCHRSDDVHQGNFGPRCENCHGTKSFHKLKEGP